MKEKANVKERIDQIEKMVPRVLNKLTRCVYPMATKVPYVSSITGFDNYNLLLNSFLSHLPLPVCLIAQNGDSYDFPLFKAVI